ncbi:unnamed protein product, partial [Thelazia callipaeda]|uniref:START domain-containing protein n=1 Tax=Thelazia callipaeda TaxID=103827 RepID=A0A0N5D520_THECL
ATFDAPCEQLFTDYWDKYEESAYRNKNTSLAQKIATFTPNVELIHHAVKDSGIVKGRDFVMTRIHRRINNEIIVAVRSYDTDEIKPHKKKIRSRILLGGGRFRIHPQDSQKSIIDFLICLDYSSIDLTKSVLESTISKHILQDTEWIRKDIEKHRRGESNK